MTEHDLRRRVVSQARSWLGRKEADGSHREIIDVYNSIKPLPNGYRMSYTDPWCAAFVSAVAWKCDLTSIIIPSASCPDMVSKYQRIGRWMEDDNYLPQMGDIVFYDWDDSGSGDNAGVPDHVGIVTDVYAGSYNIIEGNSSDMVKIRTMQRNARYIRGFGLPDYAAAAEEEAEDDPGEGTETPVTEPETPEVQILPIGVKVSEFVLSFHVLQQGAGMGNLSALREEVRAVQRQLKSLGFDVGRYGLDGEFGGDTRKAVCAYQRSVRLTADGIVGPKTRAALDGLSTF